MKASVRDHPLLQTNTGSYPSMTGITYKGISNCSVNHIYIFT